LSTPNPVPTTSEAPRKRGVLGFLFKTTLGCFAFAFGSLVVLVLLLPTLLSGTVGRWAVAGFDERYQGRLELGALSLSWFGDQSLRDLRLLDPSGAEVARASAVMPSLWRALTGGGTRFGTIRVDVEADLVQDDAGTTNLQRALAPRATEPTDDGDAGASSAKPDVAAFVRDLEADVRLDLKRVAWSDAITRRAGQPFEVRDGVVELRAKPGSPLVARITGTVAGPQPGTLEIDAQVHGPVDPDARWPLGRTEARGRIEGFSTAFVDGLSGLSGDLVEVLGPTFAMRFDAQVDSAEQGVADLVIDGSSADLAIHAQLAGGEITGGDQPFLTATMPMPRGILERVLRAKLPPDARVTLADAGKSWTVRIPKLRLPLPDPEARDLASLRPALEKAEVDIEVDLPGSATISTDALSAANLTAGISAMKLTARAAPGRPLVARFEAALDAGAPGRVQVEATVAEPFSMLAGGVPPPIDLNARIEGLSTLALGEFAGQGARVAAALGPVASVSIEARQVNLDGGNARIVVKSTQFDANVAAKIAQGVLTMDAAAPTILAWTPSPEFVAAELAPHLPPESSVLLTGAVTVSIPALSIPLGDATSGEIATLDAMLTGLTARVDLKLPSIAWSAAGINAGAPAELREAQITFEVAAGAPPVVRVAADVALDSGSIARLEVDARPLETLAQLHAGAAPSGRAQVKLTGLDTLALDRVSGQADRIAPLFGPEIALVADVNGALPKSGSIAFEVKGATGQVAIAGRIADGKFVATAEEGLSATFQVTPELLAAKLGSSLPPGTRVELAEPVRADGSTPSITIALRDFTTPIEAPDVAQRLAGTSAQLEVVLPAIAYADAKTDAASRRVVLRSARLTASLAPSAKPALHFAAQVEDSPPGAIEVDVTALDLLEKLQGEGAWKTFRVSARVHAENVPTALVDALAGQDGLLVEALGPRLQVDVQAPDVSMDRGAFSVLAEGGQNRLAVAGKLEDGNFVVESADGLDADLALGPLVMDRVVGKLLPILGKAKFLANIGESQLTESARLAPFLLNSSDVRFGLGSDLSKLNGVFRIDLGTLSFNGLPVLEQLGIALDAGEVRLPAFTVPIQDGVAQYQKLPIRIGGRDILFDGTVRLTTGEMSLATQLPLAMFGKKFERELGKIREFVPLDTAIPILLSGTWDKPRLGFQEGFLQGLLKNAAAGAAGKGLGDLLDGLLGGKKKKDG